MSYDDRQLVACDRITMALAAAMVCFREARAHHG